MTINWNIFHAHTINKIDFSSYWPLKVFLQPSTWEYLLFGTANFFVCEVNALKDMHYENFFGT